MGTAQLAFVVDCVVDGDVTGNDVTGSCITENDVTGYDVTENHRMWQEMTSPEPEVVNQKPEMKGR